MSWAGLAEFLFNSWGDLASVLGLAVSAATLAVATKARQAAEAAKAAARRQGLTEVLQDTIRKNEQVGLFLSQRKWDIVWLRAQETASATSLVLTRWPLELSAGSRDNLLMPAPLQFYLECRAYRGRRPANTARNRADLPGPRE